MQNHSSVLLWTCLLLFFALPMNAESPPMSQDFRTIEDFMQLGGSPRVIAHRGFSGIAPENTLVAMERAIDAGAHMIEIDVTLSRDGHVVLLHDETLDRTTNGQGPALATTLEEMRRLDAGSWFAAEFAGEKIPTLAEALELVKNRVLLNIEIKGEAVNDRAQGGISDKVLQLAKEHGMIDQIIISSFEPRALEQARQLHPEVKTASLYNVDLHRGQGPLAVMEAVSSNGFNLSKREVNRSILDACHGQGRPVAVYTVNKKDEMRRLLRMGVDALFTNYPDRMFEVLREEK